MHMSNWIYLITFTIHTVECSCCMCVYKCACVSSIIWNQVMGLGRVPGSVCMRSKNMPAYWGTQCGALWQALREIMEKARTMLGAGARREHPIQFRNGAGSQYKHKGFITGGSLLKAGANSPSSSTRRENIREGRREGATKRSASQRGDVT